MKRPEPSIVKSGSTAKFEDYMWMADEQADQELQQQVDEEMELIEQDFLEAMFSELLREEEASETVYCETETVYCEEGTTLPSNSSMQLPVVTSGLNPNAPEFVPKCMQAAS